MSVLYPVIGFQDAKVMDILPSTSGKACIMYASSSSSSALRKELLEKQKAQNNNNSSLEAPSASSNGRNNNNSTTTPNSSMAATNNRNVNASNANLCAKTESIFLRPIAKMRADVTSDNVHVDRLPPEEKIAFTDSALTEAHTNGTILFANINEDKDELFIFRERLISNSDLRAQQKQQSQSSIFGGNSSNNNNSNSNNNNHMNSSSKNTKQSMVSSASTNTAANRGNNNNNNNYVDSSNPNSILANYSRLCTATLFRKVPTSIFEGSTGQSQKLTSQYPISSSPSQNQQQQQQQQSYYYHQSPQQQKHQNSVTASAAPQLQWSFMPCATMVVEDVTCSVTLKFIRDSSWALRITKKCPSSSKRNRALQDGRIAKSVLTVIDAIRLPNLPQKSSSAGVLDWAKKKMSLFSKDNNNKDKDNNKNQQQNNNSDDSKIVHDEKMQLALNYDDTQKVPSISALNSPNRTCFWADVADTNESIAISLYQISGDSTDPNKRLVGLVVEQLQIPTKQDSTAYDLLRLMSTTIRYNDLNLDYYQPVRAFPIFDPKTPDETDPCYAGTKICPSFLGVALCMRLRPRFSPSSSSSYGGGRQSIGRSTSQHQQQSTTTNNNNNNTGLKFGFTSSELGGDDDVATDPGSTATGTTMNPHTQRRQQHQQSQRNNNTNNEEEDDEEYINNHNVDGNNNNNNNQKVSYKPTNSFNDAETATNVTADNYTTATLNHSSTFYGRGNRSGGGYNNYNNNYNTNNGRHSSGNKNGTGQGDVRILFFHSNAKERLIQVRGIQLECHSLREAPPTFVYFREARSIGVVSLSENLIHLVDIANIPRGPEYALASPLVNRQTDTVATRWTRPNTQFRFTEVRNDKINYVATSQNGYSVLRLSPNGLRRLSYPLLADAIAQRCSHAWVERQASYGFFMSARIPMKMSLSENAAREELIHDVVAALRPILRHAFVCLRDPVRFFIHLVDAESRIEANYFTNKQKRSHPTLDGPRKLDHLPRDQGHNTCCGVSFAADTPIFSVVHNAGLEIVHKQIVEFLNQMGKRESGTGYHWTDIVFPKLDQPQLWIQRFLKLVFATNRTPSTAAHVHHQRQLSSAQIKNSSGSHKQVNSISSTTNNSTSRLESPAEDLTAEALNRNNSNNNSASNSNPVSMNVFSDAIPSRAVPIPKKGSSSAFQSYSPEASSIKTLTPQSFSQNRGTPSKLGLSLGSRRNTTNNNDSSATAMNKIEEIATNQEQQQQDNAYGSQQQSSSQILTSDTEENSPLANTNGASMRLGSSPSLNTSCFQQQQPQPQTNNDNNNKVIVSPGMGLIGFDIPDEVIRFSIALNFCSAQEWIQSEAHVRRMMVMAMSASTSSGGNNINNSGGGFLGGSSSGAGNSSFMNLIKTGQSGSASPQSGSSPSASPTASSSGFPNLFGKNNNNNNTAGRDSSTSSGGAASGGMFSFANRSGANNNNTNYNNGSPARAIDQASSFGREGLPTSISFYSTTTNSNSAAKFFGVAQTTSNATQAGLLGGGSILSGSNATFNNSMNSSTMNGSSLNNSSSNNNASTSGNSASNNNNNSQQQTLTQQQNTQKISEIHQSFDSKTGVKVSLAAATLPDPALLRFYGLIDWNENPLELSRVISGRDSMFRRKTTGSMFEPPGVDKNLVHQLERRCETAIDHLQTL